MKKIIILLSLTLVFSNCNSQKILGNKAIVHNNKSVEIYSDAIGKEIKQIIDKSANEVLKDSLINSLSIGLYINNVSFAFNYGELTKGKGDIPTNKTIYEIASVTKTFTGTLAAKAVLEGKLDLEDDIRNYLSNSYPNLEYKGEPIKIKHLLSHTSGLPGDVIALNNEINQNSNEIEFNKIVVAHENKKTKAIFFESLSKINLTEKPGTTFNYSNAGTNLMGYILEKVYKKPFQRLIMKEVVAKVQMEDTYFNVPENKKYRLANGYLLGNPVPETKLANTLWGAEGALKSTTSDMLKFISYQFKNDAIARESHRKIFEAGPDYWICYFWWSIEDQNYDLHYRHDGGISRAKNVLAIFPENKIGISIFTNESAISVNQKLNDLMHNIYNGLKK